MYVRESAAILLVPTILFLHLMHEFCLYLELQECFYRVRAISKYFMSTEESNDKKTRKKNITAVPCQSF